MPKLKSRVLSHLVKALIILSLSLPIALLIVAFQAQPRVPLVNDLTQEDLSRLEIILIENAPPSSYFSTQQSISLSDADINLLAKYALITSNRSSTWSAAFDVEPQQLNFEATLGYKIVSFPVFLNITGSLHQVKNSLELQDLRLGTLRIPTFITNTLQDQLKSRIVGAGLAAGDIQALIDNVESLNLEQRKLALVLLWEPRLMSQLADQTQQLFVSNDDRARIAHYYEFLANIVAATPLDIRALSLNAFIVPLFQEAARRSQARQNFIQENRAALQALGTFVAKDPLPAKVSSRLSQDIDPNFDLEIRLHRREDLAKHLTAIASITSSAGAELASLISTTKEAYDARYRSGFSFSDLAANMVGVKLATLAVENETSAAWLQSKLSMVQSEDDYMPSIGNNSDGLSESDFTEIYSNRSSPQYRARLQEIEQLVNQAPLFFDSALLKAP